MRPPMAFGPWLQGGVHPGQHMMWQAGAGHQHPMQAMMWGNPCHARKWWKRQALRHALANSSTEKSNDAVTSAPDSNDVMITKTEMADMPEFARRWFDLPMQVRFRLFKLFRRSGGRLPDGVPPFVVEWFALDEKKRRELRQMKKRANGKLVAPAQSAEKEEQLPDFAREWFELPRDRKCELRKLHADVTSSNSDSDVSEKDEREKQVLPGFARAWLSLSEDERRRLRCLHQRGQHGHRHGGMRAASLWATPSSHAPHDAHMAFFRARSPPFCIAASEDFPAIQD